MGDSELKLLNVPRYTIVDAARYLHLPAATLRSWVAGRSYPSAKGVSRSELVIRRPKGSSMLSYANLLAAHVLRALRTHHGVPMREVRRALEYAEQELQIDDLLLRRELLTGGGDLFLEEYSRLIHLNKAGQLAIRGAFDAHLSRLDDYIQGRPFRFFPFTHRIETKKSPKVIMIDPRVAFGLPTTANRAIRTSVITSRINAGESVEEIAKDYNLKMAEVEEAARYEAAA